jgi:hypothetical protein
MPVLCAPCGSNSSVSAFTLGFVRRRPTDNQTAKWFWFVQGIEAVSFFATGKKDTSGKPGPATQVAGCAQNREMKIPMRLSWGLSFND